MNNPTREEVEKARDQWRYGLASVLVHDAIQLANSYLALLDENERLKGELMRGLCAFHDLGREEPCTCTDTKRQAAVVEAVIAYKDDLTVENWERVIEALAESEGDGDAG
jgi:hypothetical protein